MADREGEKSGRALKELLRVGWDERYDWAAVQRRLRSHPHEAAQRDGNGRYPLHRALCRGAYRDAPPPAVVRALLDARTDAAEAIDDPGRTPLHIACFNRCGADNVGVLLEAFPEAAKMKDLFGCIPLYYACGKEDAEVVRLLLRAHPKGVGVKNKRGWLPLHHAAWSEDATPASVRLLLDEGIRQGVEGGSGGPIVKDNEGKTPLDRSCQRIAEHGISNESWEKLVLLARAATSTTTGVMDDVSVDVTPLSDWVMLPVLHAVVKSGCPEDIIRHAISRGNPGACLERDHRGRTALAIAATMSEPDVGVVETLLGEGTEAARIVDNDTRLPLHLAAESGWSYKRGLGNLLDAKPRALATRDAVTHLYPFMLAAAEPTSNVDSTFRLLRADPSLVECEMLGGCGVIRRKIG